MKKIGKWFVAILALVVVAEGLIAFDVIPNPFRKRTPVVEYGEAVRINETLEESLHEIGELYTMEYTYTMQSICVDPCQEDPPEEEVHLTPVFLPGKFHGQRSLTGYSPRGCKELDTTEHTPSNQIIGVLESAHSGLFQPIVHFYRLPWWLRG